MMNIGDLISFCLADTRLRINESTSLVSIPIGQYRAATNKYTIIVRFDLADNFGFVPPMIRSRNHEGQYGVGDITVSKIRNIAIIRTK